MSSSVCGTLTYRHACAASDGILEATLTCGFETLSITSSTTCSLHRASHLRHALLYGRYCGRRRTLGMLISGMMYLLASPSPPCLARSQVDIFQSRRKSEQSWNSDENGGDFNRTLVVQTSFAVQPPLEPSTSTSTSALLLAPTADEQLFSTICSPGQHCQSRQPRENFLPSSTFMRQRLRT